MRTWIFLDVDGVLNKVGVPTPHPRDWSDWMSKSVSVGDSGSSYVITYSPSMLSRIEGLAERDDVQVAWLTTWREYARSALCPGIGLAGERWPVVPDDDGRATGYGGRSGLYDWWKLDALQKFWDNPRVDRTEQQFVWIDDDLRYVPAAGLWASERGGLAITPLTGNGLTPDLLDTVERFIGST